MSLKNTINAIAKAIFVVLFVLAFGLISFNQVQAYDYSGYDYGSSGYDYGNYDYSGYDYGNYDYSGYDYGNYDYSGYDYGNYDYSGYDYGNYNYAGYDYGNYNYSGYDYGNYDYSGYDYGNYNYAGYDYGNYNYSGYDYGNYASNYGGYTDYYTPGNYECYGTYCGGNDNGYTDYYTPSQSHCSGSSCGGQSRPGGMGGLGFNLSYQDNDTTITNTTCSNVGGRKNGGNCNSTVDNSTTTINKTITTTTNCSNNSGDGNCNTTNNTVVARNDERDDFDIICRVSDSSIDIGDTVTFSVEIDGGKRPFDIEWDGDISGDGASERVRFNRAGHYEAEVTVEDDNGRRASDTCSVRVGDDDDDDDDDRNVNVVTRTNLGTPTGNLASLDSVFLSQVPYTGPEDVLKALGVLAFIAIWSTAVAMYFKKRRQVRATAGRLEAFKAMNKSTATIR